MPSAKSSHLFPSVVNGYGSWGRIDLCGQKKSDRLFIAKAHTGYSGSAPLGSRPGMQIHNGTDKTAPVLAAGGSESQASSRVYAFALNSVIILPPVDEEDFTKSGSAAWCEERMRAATTQHGVVFRFAVEAGGSMIRQKFEWRKVKKGHDGVDFDGYQLVRLTEQHDASAAGASGSESAAGTIEDSAEILANLKWNKSFGWVPHLFSLRLEDEEYLDMLGDRWMLTVVMTAVMLVSFKANGKTNKSIIKVGESIRGKEAS